MRLRTICRSPRRIWQSQRRLSSLVHINPEVRSAINNGLPVVALESTIITHGMPFPRNLETAQSVESTIRRNGAVPSTIGCINGKSLSRKSSSPVKISRRDLAVVAAKGLTGGTTIAGTMILAHMAGIKVFATGGLGGVHRGGELSMDVSADLEELGRTPVGVICSGAKAILDLRRTLEYLETKGVTVTTLGEEGIEIPAFYSRGSGIKSPFNSPSVEDVARLIHANSSLGLTSGIAVFNPIPAEYSIPHEEIEVVIQQAIAECSSLGIVGKDVTPFLLQRVVAATKGQSLEANIALIENNAKAASQIAIHLSSLQSSSTHQPQIMQSEPPQEIEKFPLEEQRQPTEIMVIGGMAVDLTCTLHSLSTSTMQLHTSHPAKVHTSVGGVAHNIALAASYASSGSVRLVTSISEDPDGSWLRHYVARTGLDVQFLPSHNSGGTARYVAIHDKNGELLVAAADMQIIERFEEEGIKKAIEGGNPKFLAFDGNISPITVNAILQQRNPETRVLFEPTSVPKANVIFREPVDLGVFPRHSINIVTPNMLELKAMHQAAQDSGYFDAPEWWSILDSFKVTSKFRQDAEILVNEIISRHKLTKALDTIDPVLPDLIGEGTIQQAIALLPYIPAILVKLGVLGVLCVRLSPKDSEISKVGAPMLRLEGVHADVIVRHYPGLKDQGIISVSGAGDTFCGVLLARLAAGDLIDDAVNTAQRAAVMSLSSFDAVSEEIRRLRP